jgi:4-hydroxybenzoate polyprenyltransferase
VLKGLFKSMRPKQWAKNIFLFVPLIFDEKLLQPAPLLRALIAFVLFCLISSVVYLVNDLGDIERDKLHPVKRFRPLPSGQLPPAVAKITVALLSLFCLPLSWLLSPYFAAILLVYLLQNIAYTFWLKNVVILDVMTIAAGYVLRVAAGAIAVDVARFSPWLYLFTILLSLFIALCKRRNELLILEDNANGHRAILQEYNIRFLDEMTGLVTSGAVMAYSLYTFSAPNLPSNHSMMLTIPFVIYGVFRYLYLVHVKELGGEPEELFLKDRPLLFTLVISAILIFLIMYIF